MTRLKSEIEVTCPCCRSTLVVDVHLGRVVSHQELQREANVINVVAHDVRSLVEVVHEAGGPDSPEGVRQLGHAGMRRLG